jgi:hypothetical protein
MVVKWIINQSLAALAGSFPASMSACFTANSWGVRPSRER